MTRYSPKTGLPTTYQAGPFDSRHLYIQWGGKLPGSETWSCGLRMRSTAPDAMINDPAVLTGVKTAVQAYHTAAASFISGSAKLSFVKANVIGTDGKYVAPTTSEIVVADIPGGGPASAPYPNQIAIAVTLTTDVSRGPAHKGRFYLPLPGFVIDVNGEIDPANAVGLSGTTDTFIAALNGITSNLAVAIFSRKLGAPAHRLVTGNLVGRVLDTQRRRRRSLVEDYR